MKYEPGLTEIKRIIEISEKLASFRHGYNSYNLMDLDAFMNKEAKELVPLAHEVIKYMREIQEYNTEVSVRVAAEDWTHELEKELEVAV